MNKRGWLASGLLAAAVIGGYLGLLPLLSSLASGPAWPEPIATRDATGVVTAASPLSNDAPNGTPVDAEPATDESEVVNDAPGTTDETEGAAPAKQADEPTVVVVRVVDAGLERIPPKRQAQRPSGGSTSPSADDSSGGSSAGTPSGGGSSGGSSGGGSSGGASGGSNDNPPPSLDGISSGSLAGGGTPDDGSDDIEAGG